MAEGHRRQHFVPQCYLKAWCDPDTPAGQEPYVGRFPRDGGDAWRKAPAKIFHETELYTITDPTAGRDLRLEHGLADLEGQFATIRDEALSQERRLTPLERAVLCGFIAAAQARTPSHGNHLSEH